MASVATGSFLPRPEQLTLLAGRYFQREMCGRYVLKRKDLEELLQSFGLRSLEEFHSRFNIAPTTAIPVIRRREDGQAEAAALRWGLIPSWARDPAVGSRLTNARAEGIAEKPSFRTALRRRRCVVPASGFYEWQKIGRQKQPWYFYRRDQQPFLLAGLWESWSDPTGAALETCALITTGPNELMRPVHDRMPVILAGPAIEAWLDPRTEDPGQLTPLLQPLPAEAMQAHPVSPAVNSSRAEGPDCIATAPLLPAEEEPPQFSFDA